MKWKIPMQFAVSKKDFSRGLTYYLFLMTFLLLFCLSFLHIPRVWKYTLDVVWVALVFLFLREKRVALQKRMLWLSVPVILFLLFTFFRYCFGFQSPFYYLWGFRNYFRFYAAFFAFYACFDKRDVPRLMGFLNVLFWVNFFVSLVQYFAFGYRQDHLGGIFGLEKGVNGATVLFFIVVMTYSVLSYFNGKEAGWRCFLNFAAAILIAALAELKFFMVICAMILVASACLTKFSAKKCIFLLLSAGGIVFGNLLLMYIFGENDALSLRNIWELITAEHYSSEQDLGRMTAISTLSETILKDPVSRHIGFGLGNCETSSFALCNTPFYEAHSHLHYTWLSSAFLFLETGYIGLFLYLSFFLICFGIYCYLWKTKRSDVVFCQMGLIISMICCILTFYNSSLRMDIGYMMYFALALPLIMGKADAPGRGFF